MRHRVFFYVLFVVFVAAAVTALLFNLSYLPQPVYDFIAMHLSAPTGPTYPYLEKFEGRWSILFEPSVTGTDVTRCESQSGYLTVHNGTVTGTMGQMTGQVEIRANVDQAGNLSGKTLNSGEVGTVTAVLEGGQGTGEVIDAVDCRGNVTLTKLDPVVDPVAGKFISSQGDVILHRGDGTVELSPSEPLYAGDIIDVPKGAEVFLTLGLLADPVNLTGPTVYTVPSAK